MGRYRLPRPKRWHVVVTTNVGRFTVNVWATTAREASTLARETLPAETEIKTIFPLAG